LRFRGEAREYPVESLTSQGNGFVLKLGGVDTIGAAEALAGAEILVPEDGLEPLESGRVFVADLIGCAVVAIDGRPLGEVGDVWETGGSAVLVVERPAGGSEILIPLSEVICPVIDTKARRIVVDPPDGLLDLNEI
jgi:16S rRNA processing protein RimM